MQRWDANTMQTIGSKLFDKIHKRKKHSHHNHEIHFMARDRQWLPQGIQSLVDGTYEPRCLKRYYFSDEMVDQLHISDRIFQHILLRILKPTFKHVMNQIAITSTDQRVLKTQRKKFVKCCNRSSQNTLYVQT